MKILLVEDDDNKRTQVEAFVREEFPDAVIEAAKSLHSGLRKALATSHDLVLLDMTLPAYDVTPREDGFRYLSYGGREFLEQLERHDVHVKVVVVTGFDTFGDGADGLTLEALDTELRTDYPAKYLGRVWYSPVVDRWRAELKAILRSASDA